MLHSVDAVGVRYIIVNIEDTHRVIGIDVDVIDIVRRGVEHVSVDGFDEAFSGCTFFLKIDFAFGCTLGVDNDGVVFLAVRSTAEGDAELIGSLSRSDGHGDVVMVLQTVEERIAIRFECIGIVGKGYTCLGLCHHFDGFRRSVLAFNTLYFTEGKRTVFMLDKTMCYK